MRTLLVASAIVAPLSAAAEPRHDGVYLQVTPGVGVAATSAKLDDGSTVSLSGAGGSFGIVFGAAVTENWIVAGDLSGTSVFSPTLKMNDMEVKTVDDVKWNTGYLGVSTAYYFMPLNVHVGGGIGAFRMALDVPKMDLSRSKVGGAAKLGVGKQWWLGDHLGLGVNLEAVAGAVPDDSPASKGWGFFSTDLAVSATYN